MMRMIMTASIDQAGRKVNLDAADGVGGRDSMNFWLEKAEAEHSGGGR